VWEAGPAAVDGEGGSLGGKKRAENGHRAAETPGVRTGAPHPTPRAPPRTLVLVQLVGRLDGARDRPALHDLRLHLDAPADEAVLGDDEAAVVVERLAAARGGAREALWGVG
jgi:hypothetical protein